jgi:hypothetical protein
MRKIVIMLILVLCVLFNGIWVSVQAITPGNVCGSLIEKDNVDAVFSKCSLDQISNAANINSVTLSVLDANINKNSVNIVGKISGLARSEINLSGNLYKSVLQNNGLNAYVADLKDLCGNYDVLYFLIRSDSSVYEFALNDKAENGRDFVLYLRDKDGNVLAFEDTVDKLGIDFSNIDAPNVASSRIDSLWFAKILSPVNRGIIASESSVFEPNYGMVIDSIHSSYIYSPILYTEWSYGGYLYRESCWAKINGLIVDIPHAGTSSAQTTITLCEHLYQNGVEIGNDTLYTIQNESQYGVRDMYGKIALGYNSAVTCYYWDGNYWTSSGFRTSITASLGGGFSTPFASASLYLNLEAASAIYNGSNHLKTLYPDGSGNYPKNAIKKIPKANNIWLENNGDYLDMVATVATIDSSAATDVVTTARFAWTFDVLYDLTVQASYTNKGLALTYTSNDT